ncbi:MAG: glycosyltransferase [Spirochaetes bacterium]|nr:glycosyltransferase [Spirochaetota bacterium]
MKIHILYHLKSSPTGGGNQFLKNLKHFLKESKVYAEDIKKADTILFNSHQFIMEVAQAKRRYKNKIFVHRIDGPMRAYNNLDDRRDLVVGTAGKLISDATIFQSHWSKKENYRQGFHKNAFETVIINAPDNTLFNRKGKIKFSSKRKTRLIAVSWSTNPQKGFDVYRWMDEHLDFKRYEMDFIGNSTVKFKNIKQKPPMKSSGLAKQLKKSDIFIFASKIEACSNALLEALHCGLPCLAYGYSSNPEIVGKAGECFKNTKEIPALLKKIVKRYSVYQKNMTLPSIEQIGKRYYDFLFQIYKKVQSQRYEVKKFSLLDYLKVMATHYLWIFGEKVKGKIRLLYVK